MTPSQEGASAIAGAVVLAVAIWRIERRWPRRRGTTVGVVALYGVAGVMMAMGLDLISRGDPDDALPLGSWHEATPGHVMPTLFMLWSVAALWSRKGPMRAVRAYGPPQARIPAVIAHAAVLAVIVSAWTDHWIPVAGPALLVMAAASWRTDHVMKHTTPPRAP